MTSFVRARDDDEETTTKRRERAQRKRMKSARDARATTRA